MGDLLSRLDVVLQSPAAEITGFMEFCSGFRIVGFRMLGGSFYRGFSAEGLELRAKGLAVILRFQGWDCRRNFPV